MLIICAYLLRIDDHKGTALKVWPASNNDARLGYSCPVVIDLNCRPQTSKASSSASISPASICCKRAPQCSTVLTNSLSGSASKASRTCRVRALVVLFKWTCLLLRTRSLSHLTMMCLHLCSCTAFDPPQASQQAESHMCSRLSSRRAGAFPSTMSWGWCHPASPR